MVNEQVPSFINEISLPLLEQTVGVEDLTSRAKEVALSS
jgi:hypothetical protein